MKWIKIIGAGILLCGCVTTQNSMVKQYEQDAVKRKGEYFYLEAQRQKLLSNETAAFDLIKKAVEVDSTNAAAYFELADYYLALGRPEVSITVLEKARGYDKNNYWYSMMLANLYQRTQKSDKAIEILEYLASVHPSTPEIYYAISESYAMDNRLEDAIKALNKTEEKAGMVETLSRQKYNLYMAMGDTLKAFNEIELLVGVHPNNMQYRLLLGALYTEQKMFDKAKQAFDDAALIDPNNAYLILSYSDYYNRTGDAVASEKLLKEALVNEELDVKAKVQLLTDYLQRLVIKKEPLNDTQALFEVIINQHPQDSSVRTLYAEVLGRLDKKKEAIEQLEYAVATNPNEENNWKTLALYYASDSNWDKLLEVAKKANEYFPASYPLYLYQGIAYQNKNDNESARDIYMEAIEKVDQKDVATISTLYGQIGDIWYQLKDLDKTYEAYDKALDYNKNNMVVLNNYAYFLSLDKKDLDKAERMASTAMNLEPNNPTYIDTYAWVLFQQGSYNLAKFYLESAMQKGGDKDADILEHYGDVMFMQGDKEKALDYWKQALEKGSESETLKMKIEHKSYITK